MQVHTPLTYSQEVQTQLVPNVYLLGLLTAATLGLKRYKVGVLLGLKYIMYVDVGVHLQDV